MLMLQSLKDWLCVMSSTTSWTMRMNNCHIKMEQATTNDSTMSSFSSDFDETTVMFLKFIEDLNSPTGESPLVDDNLAPSAKKPILPHTIWFNQAIGVCVRKTFSVHYLRWADVGREMHQSCPGRSTAFFVLDFRAIYRYVQYTMDATYFVVRAAQQRWPNKLPISRVGPKTNCSIVDQWDLRNKM
ncbi:CACTA en-spm transposon protein [Cucumis melo var. makuwa]|uniref:CACTA en-spm transposon protein n=1 Tax=Cucumis melo var. makuwa TaxID=1194695 RepID=A0A5D3BPG8_CUCMM|nr:CACTA en-spm transposon protein [Cucumis melo var. makuwa]TYK00156.1 CACTA en-spm transposon protein [Cucumis melo var. makuwa]